jgi:HK97 family phage prohead protease
MSKRNLITVDEFRAAARAKRAPADATVLRFASCEPKAVDGQARTLRFCFSDGSVDRAGDTISPTGWDLTGFKKNPVALWAHDSYSPPIGRASNVVVEEGARLMGDIAFIDADTYAFSDTIYKLTLGGYINAVSVGFVPKDYEWSDEDGREWGIDFKQQELLEISVVPVPCNANALIEARAKGIDTGPLQEWLERMLDAGGGSILMPRKLLEDTFKAAKTPRSVRQKYLGATGASQIAAAAQQRDGAVAETDPAAGGAAVETVQMGDCGMASDAECGMKDPSQCATHAPLQDVDAKRVGTLLLRVARGVKAGRVLSAANEKDLRDAAANHAKAVTLHETAMAAHADAASCLKAAAESVTAVLARHDAATADDTAEVDPPVDDKATRLAKVATLRERTKPAA